MPIIGIRQAPTAKNARAPDGERNEINSGSKADQFSTTKVIIV